jgi:hypothetical protein
MRPNTGGKRAGAGRPPSATTLKTRALADRFADDGEVLPLEVLIKRMRKLWASDNVADQREAVQVAAQAAAFVHPRLVPVAARHVSLKLPPLDSLDHIAKAHAVVANALAAGELDASAAKDMTAMLGHAREALEATVIEARLTVLEERVGGRR